MKRSTDRIITSHAGTLQRRDLMAAGVAAAGITDEQFYAMLPAEVEDVVKRQIDIGIDVVNDGEYGKKGGFSNYVQDRLGGIEPLDRDVPPRNVMARDGIDFPGFYSRSPGAFGRLAAGGAVGVGGGTAPRPVNLPVFCTGPITYAGQEAVQRDIKNLKAALAKAGNPNIEAYLPANTVGTIEHWLWNDYYKSQEEYLFALADAMHEEYKAITDAGLILQLDDPDLPDGWQMYPELSIADYRRYAETRVEATNHALRDIPESQIRLHVCWGSFHGPHKNDIGLKDIVDIVLRVKAECVSVEAANPRHEHEWALWEEVKLPEGKSLMPGVVGHATDLIEHPELVAQRLVRYANVIGRENVIAGTDCGLGYRVGHEEIMWAKLDAMVEGARIATKQLWAK
ncbi:MAG TPA: cobalamin-independent methionine synthase II family protein [Dehalococcoidia bacterium]|nr:cobalamin-independent methionine synthase II family protein [Dehalococcoidia bacterium]